MQFVFSVLQISIDEIGDGDGDAIEQLIQETGIEMM